MQVLCPEAAAPGLRIAAEEFVRLYRAATGLTLSIREAGDDAEDWVVIGADDENPVARQALLEGWVPGFSLRYGTDGYTLLSAQRAERTVLFVAGARPRATLYAVYAFFALRAGCRWFWDGDIIPQAAEIDIGGLSVHKSPAFALRGLRYFAHRGLHRFQAEHWGWEDWKREIDWLLKKGMNLFMLRIGQDDLFQKAFPEWVDYPAATGRLPEAGEGYDDRTLFWPLEYRGQLRKKILDYAFARDLLHPEDCGTTTHWYTRTPLQFLERAQPAFIPQVSEVYAQPTGRVWDIRRDEHLDNYFRLTRAHVAHYGRPDIFHTIGLAERMVSADRAENMRYKRMTYHRIFGRLRAQWPNAPVLVASWDFAMNWLPEEVRALLEEMNPAQQIILDYTADTKDPVNNYKSWGFAGRFPWVFGVFHAFLPNSDVRGDYAELAGRLADAGADPFCRGLVYWPEVSHSDTLMLEYLAACGWEAQDPDAFLARFCQERYGAFADAMHAAWQALWPLLPLRTWELDREAHIEDMHQEYFFDILGYRPLRTLPEEKVAQWRRLLAEDFEAVEAGCHAVEQALAALPAAAQDNAFVRRDSVDIARTAMGRKAHYLVLRALVAAADGRAAAVRDAGDACLGEMEKLAALLHTHEDYAMADSLARLRAEHPVNPDFEAAYKHNVSNSYCRAYVWEVLAHLCLPECAAYFAWLTGRARAGMTPDSAAEEALSAEKQRIMEAFMALPLSV